MMTMSFLTCDNFVGWLVLDEAGWAKMFICSVNAMVSALFSVWTRDSLGITLSHGNVKNELPYQEKKRKLQQKEWKSEDKRINYDVGGWGSNISLFQNYINVV